MSKAPYSGAALRRGTWQFLTGKAASALLTFSILLWLVRLLPVAEYGAYVILVAGMELGFALAGLGLPWLAARYLPEYRLHASGAVLTGLCQRLLAWQVLALLAFVALLAALLDIYLTWAELDRFHTPAQIYLVVLLIDGLGRFLREALMGPLMLQGEMRSSMVLRQLSFLILIAILSYTSHGVLLWVAWAELTSSILGMVVALILLWRHLLNLRDQTGQPGWSPPALVAQWHVAGRMYAAHLLTLTYSPQVFISLIQRTLGIEAAAMFGFLRTLHEQIARYLPATLLFSLIRSKLVASYVSGGGMAELSCNANLAGKLSLFALMPLLALAALAGDPLVTWLSSNKFADSGWLLLGFMLVLVPYSQRQLIEAVAVTSGHANLCTWAAASGLVMLPLMWAMLQFNLGLWAAIIAIGLGHFLFNTVVVMGLSKWAGYQADWVGFVKLVVSALAAYGISILLHLENSETWASPWLPVVLQCALAVLVYLVLAWWVKPFTADERDRINALVKRRVFVW